MLSRFVYFFKRVSEQKALYSDIKKCHRIRCKCINNLHEHRFSDLKDVYIMRERYDKCFQLSKNWGQFSENK